MGLEPLRDAHRGSARHLLHKAVSLGLILAALLSGCASLAADGKVTSQVRAALAQAPALTDAISIQTVHGVVYLRGVVSTPYQVAQAESLARQVPGVTDVQNQLVINNSY